MESTVLIQAGQSADAGSVTAEHLRDIIAELETSGLRVRWVARPEDALAVISSDATLAALLVEWDGSDGGAADGARVLRGLARRHAGLPSFALVDDEDLHGIPLWVYEQVQGFIWLLEDTPSFIAGRVVNAVRGFQDRLLPPFFSALQDFDHHHEYSWHTPSHAGGIAFLKSAVGRAYFDYYGEQLFRTDLSISVTELGSPLEHTGAVGAAERNAARVFGADRTFFVLNGNSTANRVAGHHFLARDEIALVDRNCHKSIQHVLTISGGRPVYLTPTRNGLGICGPIPPAALSQEAIGRTLAAANLAAEAASSDPAYAVVTNSTYDGLCYDAVRVAGLLSGSVPRVHFDEAWFAYARFNPLYRNRYGMAVDETSVPGPDRPTIITTQSTHKLLAALSQAAMLHVRSAPRAPVDFDRLNETYLMHASTSPLYPMIASLDVAAAMMDGPGGQTLTGDAIVEAVRFRQAMSRLADRIRESGDRPPWFFGSWQPPTVTDPGTGVVHRFQDAPLDPLCTEPACWSLEPGASWHGFGGLESGYCMLDPIKVTITCPGVTADGTIEEQGIPARLLAGYLDARNIVVEKVSDYTILILFSIGITKGKWGTLLDALIGFKDLYDGGARVRDVLPGTGFDDLTLPDLCARMHRQLSGYHLGDLLHEVFTDLPEPALTPAACYQKLIRSGTERLPLDKLAGHIAATKVVVTPPGIPMLMPGEAIGPADGPVLSYLSALQAFDKTFPAFTADISGVHRDASGDYWIEAVTR